MAKMRIYTVHINPSKKHPYETPIFVEEHFNVFAFVFREFWAFYHRIWSVGIALLGFRFLAVVAMQLHWVGVIPTFAVTLGIMLWMGFTGNDLRREKLKKQGFITVDIVTSDNLVGAEQRYFERYFSKDNIPSSRMSPEGVAIPALG